MRAAILDQLAVMDKELDQLFTELDHYSSEQLNRSPAPESWSVTQVLNHLLLSEKYSLQYCEKKLSFEPNLPKAGLAAAARALFVNWYLFLPLKVKAPALISTSALPKEDDLANIKTQYQTQRQLLRAFLEQLEESYLDREVYKHPFAGRLSFPGMFSFMTAHFRHHRKQIYRALA
ncbi:MAG: DinB family protein [Lewinella sp.]|jgi:uncharacterized damage-inducible protein DinB|uniref:DinB family protein n=1 Tax=Lewinella sp. TaxID=2004506 RepID=UPI003D6B6A1E